MSISRRDFLSLVGTSVAGAAAVAATAKATGRTVGVHKAPAHNATWKVSAVGRVQQGSVPVTLTHEATGEQLRIDICRRSAGAQPVARSARYDLFVVNGGTGATPTTRDHHVAARALAKKLDQAGVKAPKTLKTMERRLAEHPELHDNNDDFFAYA